MGPEKERSSVESCRKGSLKKQDRANEDGEGKKRTDSVTSR